MEEIKNALESAFLLFPVEGWRKKSPLDEWNKNFLNLRYHDDLDREILNRIDDIISWTGSGDAQGGGVGAQRRGWNQRDSERLSGGTIGR